MTETWATESALDHALEVLAERYPGETVEILQPFDIGWVGWECDFKGALITHDGVPELVIVDATGVGAGRPGAITLRERLVEYGRLIVETGAVLRRWMSLRAERADPSAAMEALEAFGTEPPVEAEVTLPLVVGPEGLPDSVIDRLQQIADAPGGRIALDIEGLTPDLELRESSTGMARDGLLGVELFETAEAFVKNLREAGYATDEIRHAVSLYAAPLESSTEMTRAPRHADEAGAPAAVAVLEEVVMRLWIVSDLHCDSSLWSPASVPEHGVLVVAGDVSNSPEGAIQQLQRLAQFTPAPIVVVPGNHDYFGGELDTFDIVDIPGINVLTPGVAVVIGGVRFIGATLWTDWLLNDHEFMAQRWAARTMPEYARVVRDDGDLIWPVDVAAEHQRHRRAIDELLAVPHPGPTVVVTHHAPSIRSIHPGERTDVASAAFASDLEDLMLRHRPALWVHGHVHWASDYRVGDTRVVCNPRGYQSEGFSERTGWREDLVLEV